MTPPRPARARHSRERPPEMLCLSSRKDEVIDPTPDWECGFASEWKCSVCDGPGPRWFDAPFPIDVELCEQPNGALGCVGMTTEFMSLDLWMLLRTYLPGVLAGEITVCGRRARPRYVALWVPRDVLVFSSRSYFCRHQKCVGNCGVIVGNPWWMGGAFLERDVRDRRACCDELQWIHVKPDLARELDLHRRFPDLYAKSYPIIPEPLDGEVLPGDPGWDGVLRPNKKKPKLPKVLRPIPRVRWSDIGC